jgi:hypothetical protein
MIASLGEKVGQGVLFLPVPGKVPPPPLLVGGRKMTLPAMGSVRVGL